MVARSSKAQSALEYLSSYGFALVLVVVLIAALVMVISPEPKLTVTSSSLKITVTNQDADPNTGELVIKLVNTSGRTITITDVITDAGSQSLGEGTVTPGSGLPAIPGLPEGNPEGSVPFVGEPQVSSRVIQPGQAFEVRSALGQHQYNDQKIRLMVQDEFASTVDLGVNGSFLGRIATAVPTCGDPANPNSVTILGDPSSPRVYFPADLQGLIDAGKTACFLVQNDVTLDCDPSGSGVKGQITTGIVGIILDSRAGEPNAVTNFKIQNCAVNAEWGIANYSYTPQNVAPISNLTIENTDFTGYTTLFMRNVANLIVTGSSFSGQSGMQMERVGTASVTQSSFETPGYWNFSYIYGTQAVPGQSWVLSNNVFTDTYFALNWVKSASITNNTIQNDNSSSNYFQIYNAIDNSSISNNTFSGRYSMSYIVNSDQATISNNTIAAGAGTAGSGYLYISDSSNATIVDNTFSGNGAGLSLYRVTNSTIRDNTVTGGAQYVYLSVNTGENVVIENNDFDAAQYSSAYFYNLGGAPGSTAVRNNEFRNMHVYDMNYYYRYTYLWNGQTYKYEYSLQAPDASKIVEFSNNAAPSGCTASYSTLCYHYIYENGTFTNYGCPNAQGYWSARAEANVNPSSGAPFVPPQVQYGMNNYRLVETGSCR